MEPEGQHLECAHELSWPRKDTMRKHESLRSTRSKAQSSKSGSGSSSFSFVTKLWHPSVGGEKGKEQEHEGLPLPVLATQAQTQKVEMVVDNRPLDPWVKRCRLAAIVSGSLVVLGILVAVIVLAGFHRS